MKETAVHLSAKLNLRHIPHVWCESVQQDCQNRLLVQLYIQNFCLLKYLSELPMVAIAYHLFLGKEHK